MLNEINAEREQVDPGAVRLDEYVVERVSILFWLVGYILVVVARVYDDPVLMHQNDFRPCGSGSG